MDYLNKNPIRYISKNDLPKFSIYESNRRKQLTPTDYDIEKLYEWILNERDNPPNVGRWVNQKRFGFNWLLPMLMVWMKSGVRNETLCSLELRNVWWDENKIKYEKNKFDKEGYVYLDDDLKEWLKPLIIDDKTNDVFSNRKYIFVGKKGNKFNPNFVSTYFIKIRKELKEKYPQFNYELTIHSFRRYFINKGLRMGLGLSLIRKSVNHSSYNTLLKYETDLILDEELPTTTLPTPNLGEKPSKDDIRRNIESEIEKLQKELKTI
jgi:integrase